MALAARLPRRGYDAAGAKLTRPRRNLAGIGKKELLELAESRGLIPQDQRVQVKRLKDAGLIGTIELTDQEYDQLLKESGEVGGQMVDLVIASPLWSTIPKELRREMIEEAYGRGRRLSLSRARVRVITQRLQGGENQGSSSPAALAGNF